ncbi:MAG: histone deacetylase [Spirochaetaceae bacterium]|jgi:acetoin utilization deacetylase AcuC-like enzyme|nr:histone deacetylase [Spirochaetaceae bacterium]
MLLYDKKLEANMSDYGIGIPMSPSRPGKILRYLEKCRSALPLLSLEKAVMGLGLDSPLLSREDLERVHQREFVARLYGEPRDREKEILKTYELIRSDGTYNRYEPEKAVKALGDLFKTILYRVSGSYLACRLALEGREQFCFYLGGGQHHGRYDSGSGFCLLNDVILAARKIQAEGRADLIWIIDVDAHKGDGSAELVKFSRDRGETFQGRNPEIITLSVHMAAGWPLDSESIAGAEPGRAPLVESDLDIPIAEHEEARYLPRLIEGLGDLEKRSGQRKPGLVIVVDGVDVYEKDGLASTALIALSKKQCLERDQLIFSFLHDRGLPSAWLMAGGYGEDAWEPTANFLASLAADPETPFSGKFDIRKD